MGNYRFRLSDMMPNAWFYKLKDMNRRTRKHTNNTTRPPQSNPQPAAAAAAKIKHSSPVSQHHNNKTSTHYVYDYEPTRYSHYSATEEVDQEPPPKQKPKPKPKPLVLRSHFSDPPRKSSKRSSTRPPRRKTIYKPSPSPRSTSSNSNSNSIISISAPYSTCTSCSHNHIIASTQLLPSQSPAPATADHYCSPPMALHDDYYDYDYNHDYDSLHSLPSENFNIEFGCDDDFGGANITSSSTTASASCNCRVSSSTNDIIIDMNNEFFTTRNVEEKLDGYFHFHTNNISEIELPPILTKPPKFNPHHHHYQQQQESLSVKIVKEDQGTDRIQTQKVQNQVNNPLLPRKAPSSSSSASPSSIGIRLRSNSPRIASKKIQAAAYARKSTSSANKSRNRSFSESLAIVKSSFDPQRDFRESMVEMIVENNIRASKDLEDLLACYLSLNSDEYHDLIVKAFEQIWFHMPAAAATAT